MQARAGAHDVDIGLRGYLTSTPPLGGRLKVRVSDFIVDEVGGEPPEDPGGPFTCAVVRLSNWETNRFVRDASERLRVSRKKIHFSGTKDKRGVTTRVFTFEASPDAVAGLASMPGVELQRVYRTRVESELGDHTGNRFEIVVRDLPGDRAHVESTAQDAYRQALTAGGFPNVFGPQRFGSVRATTHLVGMKIVRGEFMDAVRAYLSYGPASADEQQRAEWLAAVDANDFPRLLRLTGDEQGFERALLHRLVERPDDAVNALGALPKNLQLLFVSALQSFLFNEIVSERIAQRIPLGAAMEGDLVAPIEDGAMGEEWVPVTGENVQRVNEEVRRGRAAVTGILPGTEVPFAGGVMGSIERAVLGGAGLTRSNFIVPEHLEWSSRGLRRAIHVTPAGWQVRAEPDELHPGRTKATFRFSLPRGAYATSVLREVLKLPQLTGYG